MAMSAIPLRPDMNAMRAAAAASITRASIATGLHILERVGGHEKMWPHDRDVDLLLRSAMTPTSTTNAAALIRVAYAFVDALIPLSAAAALISRSLQLSFDGAASISLPSLALPQADFVAQGKPIPVVQGTSSAGVTLEPHKLASIVPLSGEMLRNSNSEQIVRAVLMDNVGPSLDAAMFSTAAAVADLRPPGLLNGITALTPSAGTNKAESMVDDVSALAAAVAPVAGNAPIILIAAPAQSVALQMRPNSSPFSVFTSSALPPKRVICVAARALVTAMSAPVIDASREAAVHMASPASELIDIGGVMAVPVKSMTQTDGVALRLRMPVAWALRSPVAISFMDNVTW
jgi:hypothetical protein